MVIRLKSEHLDYTFHALADPTRRGMLALLSQSDRTASELGKPFRISQPAASKHIKTLERAALVKRSQDGRHQRFRLDPKPLLAAEDWITKHRQFWEGSLQQLDFVLAELQKGQREK